VSRAPYSSQMPWVAGSDSVEASSQRLNFRQNVGPALTIEHPDRRHRRMLRARRDRPCDCRAAYQ